MSEPASDGASVATVIPDGIADSVSAALDQVALELENDYETRNQLRDVCREVERTVGEIYYEVITARSFESDETESLLHRVRAAGQKLQHSCGLIIPSGSFYAFNDVVKRTWREMCLLTQYLNYRQSCKILSYTEMVASFRGESDVVIQLNLEDYLAAQVLAVNEVSRQAMKSVLSGSPTEPSSLKEVQQCADFCDAILRAQQLMNFKNSELRRIYDSLKYQCAFAKKMHAELSFVAQKKNLLNAD